MNYYRSSNGARFIPNDNIFEIVRTFEPNHLDSCQQLLDICKCRILRMNRPLHQIPIKAQSGSCLAKEVTTLFIKSHLNASQTNSRQLGQTMKQGIML